MDNIKEPTLLEVIEKMKIEKNSKEYCLYIVKGEISKQDFKKHQNNVKATKYFSDVSEDIPYKNYKNKMNNDLEDEENINLYNKEKNEIDEYFNLEFLPKLLYINDFEILASLPVFDFSILEEQ